MSSKVSASRARCARRCKLNVRRWSPALRSRLFGQLPWTSCLGAAPLCRAENNLEDFKKRIDVSLPKQGANLQFSFMAE